MHPAEYKLIIGQDFLFEHSFFYFLAHFPYNRLLPGRELALPFHLSGNGPVETSKDPKKEHSVKQLTQHCVLYLVRVARLELTAS